MLTRVHHTELRQREVLQRGAHELRRSEQRIQQPGVPHINLGRADLPLLEILKPGGRAGLVLPDGTLFGERVKTRIKEALLTECNLHTIFRLPHGVFNPYTGIRTNLLFFTKGAPTKEVWYYEHPYPPGAKSYNKGKPIRIEEFEAERAWRGDEADGFASRVENEQAWRVSIEQIKAGNFNLDLKNPHSTDTGPGDVGHLLPEYEKLLAQIAETRSKLKRGLQAALEH
jgi:type I restriction enzyme M protein